MGHLIMVFEIWVLIFAGHGGQEGTARQEDSGAVPQNGVCTIGTSLYLVYLRNKNFKSNQNFAEPGNSWAYLLQPERWGQGIGQQGGVLCFGFPGSSLLISFWKVENFGMEVKDFEGAVKMQGAMMDKLAASRLFLRFRSQAAFKLFLKLKF